MAKIEWVDQRLERWAMWVSRGKRGNGGGCHPMWRNTPSDGPACEAAVPLSDLECGQTEDAINALNAIDPAVAETVGIYYLSGSFAAQDRMRVDRSVISQRINKAHRWFAQQWSQPSPLESQLPGGFTP